MNKIKISRRFSAFLIFAFSNAVIFAVLRVIFYFLNRPSAEAELRLIRRAFAIGTRFDLRIAFIFALPLGVLFLLPYKKWYKKTFAFIYSVAFSLITLVYFVDFGYYAYLQERLNSYIIELAANTGTSLEMVWQTYPVIKGALALLVIGFLYYVAVKKFLNWVYSKTEPKRNYWYILPALMIAGIFIHGRFSQYPLRWSNAYFTPNAFISSLALNPLQNVYDTYAFAKKGSGYDKKETAEYYGITADYLGVKNKDAQNLNFERNIPQAATGAKDYNIVIIITESLAYDKTSFNNPDLDTTPELKALAARGTLFRNFFTPTVGTARGVFTSITGLPDTSAAKTASRNPRIVKQHSLIDDIKGYDKFYFIGGSTNWGNVRGLLQNNIEGLQIYEEGTYKDVARTDVWGISDLDMFRYAAKELKRTERPFIAVLQTAGFHRPYTIPKDRGIFEVEDISDEAVKPYGFDGGDEYNALRFQDYAMGEFFRLIENEEFFNNTIFFIYGDHGLSVKESKNTPKSMLDLGLVAHNTPLVVIGPGVKRGLVSEREASQMDITATMAGLLGKEHRATGLGRNIFDVNLEKGAFVVGSAAAPLRIGFLQDGYYYVDWPTKKGMYKYRSGDSETDYCPQYPEKCARMAELSKGLFEAARYITYNHN